MGASGMGVRGTTPRLDGMRHFGDTKSKKTKPRIVDTMPLFA
jgi:hypothetical protein